MRSLVFILITILFPCWLLYRIGRPVSGTICLILQLTMIGWGIAIIWAFVVLVWHGLINSDVKIVWLPW